MQLKDLLDPEELDELLKMKTKLSIKATRPRREQVVLVNPEILGDYPEVVQRAHGDPD